jgi:hypothetical protein
MSSKPEHWRNVYRSRSPKELSWFQPRATLSLDLIARAAIPMTAPIVDVGAGASMLADGLLARGYRDVTLLDLADEAFDDTRRRLRSPAGAHYVVSDVTAWAPSRRYALWHDRATFHFLTDEKARGAYRKVLASALASGGHAIVATFALEGPERCSGLPVRRYSAETLAAAFAGTLRLVEEAHEDHVTPAGITQRFVFGRFVRD